MATFQEVDSHVSSFTPGPLPKTHAEAAIQVCPTWKAVKPVLVMLLEVPFIPAKWKTLGNMFVGTMDVFCP
jgi:hypothetical protein